MAFCANCGHEISELAAACPKCGHPNEARTTTGELADLGSRFAAALLDGLILLIPIVFVAFVFLPAAYASSFFYSWLMLGLNDGRTIGKHVLGIRIVRADGGPIDLGTAAARSGMAIVSSLILYVGYLWAIWDPERRTLHDIVADTRAVRVSR
jgi:uncharacterized RDD family membrane protein YckC